MLYCNYLNFLHMKISTKKGDKGKTTLLKGIKVDKDHPIIDLNGTIDELNSAIGVAASYIKENKPKEAISHVQKKLFNIGSNIATPIKEKTQEIQKIFDSDIKWLENQIDDLEQKLPELNEFILPGGEKGAAHLFHARAICRKAERKLVTYLKKLKKEHPERKKEIDLILIYLNRLSDYLFLSARDENIRGNKEEAKWKDKTRKKSI
jgi:cob(I)alamin adenosyltransferase